MPQPHFSEKGRAVIEERLNKADPQEETILGKVETLLKAADKPFGEEQRDVATAVLRTAGDSDQPDDARAAALAGMFGVIKAEEPPAEQPVKLTPTPPKTETPTLLPELDDLMKSDSVMATVIQKAAETSPDMVPVLALLLKRDVEKDARITELTDDKAQAVAVAKADSTGIIGDRTKLASLIQKAEKAGFGDELMAELSAAGEQIKHAALFGEVGSSATAPGSAIDQLDIIAKSMIEKDGKLDEAAALDKAIEQNPKLYVQAEEERAGGVH